MKKWTASLPLVVLALFFALSSQAKAEMRPPLLVVTEQFAPYNFEAMGEARGISTRVVQAVLNHAGLEADIEFYPWPRAYRYAQTKPNTLIYSIARIPEREDLFEWIGAIAPYQTSLYKLRSREDIKIESLRDARKYRVGASQADVITTYLEGQGFEALEVARNDEIAIGMLAHDRIDVAALDEASLGYRSIEAGIDYSHLERVLPIEGLTGELYIAMSLKSNPDLVETLRASLRAIKEDGTYDRLVAGYFRRR
jgi:polar amino acid transport system substrate-binding protein